MKNILISIVTVTMLLVAGLFISKNNKNLISTAVESPTVTAAPSLTQKPTISPESETETGRPTNSYNVEWIIVRDPKKIELYSNAEEKLTSSDAITKYGCVNLISGGFWREDNGEPMGLFITEGNKLSSSSSSSLLNGYFYVDNTQNFDISKAEPSEESIKLALQSGPILYLDSEPQNVKSESDEKARRVVVAKTKKGEIVFMIFYYKPQPLTGPLLSDLPELLNDLYKTSNLKVESALNLDGGAHSAFITSNVNISEVARVGSFFCIKP